MSRLLVLCLTLAGCATTVPTFFGAVRTGPYVDLYNGQIRCAPVNGWGINKLKSECRCLITDPGFSKDRTLIGMPDEICSKDK
jgi:hypothetical protein